MKKNKVQVFDVINNGILLLVALACIYPFLYVFFVACSNGTYLQRGEVSFFPKGFNLEAFKYILGSSKFHVWTGLRNSFLYTAGGPVVAVLTTYVTAYALSRDRLKGRYFLMGAFIITWVFDAGIIPQYIIYNKLGFIDNPWVMIIPGAINTQFLIITKTFVEGILKELDEAAVVDGANDWTILTRLYLPPVENHYGHYRHLLRGIHLEPVSDPSDLSEIGQLKGNPAGIKGCGNRRRGNQHSI